MPHKNNLPTDGLPSDEKLAQLNVRRIKPGEFDGALESWNKKFEGQGMKPPVMLLYEPGAGFDAVSMAAYTHHQKGKPSYVLFTPDMLQKMEPAQRDFVENHEASHALRNHKEGELPGIVLQIDQLAAQEGFRVNLNPGKAIPEDLQVKQEYQADFDAAKKACDVDAGIGALKTVATANGLDLQSGNAEVIAYNNRVAHLQGERGQVEAFCKPSSGHRK